MTIYEANTYARCCFFYHIFCQGFNIFISLLLFQMNKVEKKEANYCIIGLNARICHLIVAFSSVFGFGRDQSSNQARA